MHPDTDRSTIFYKDIKNMSGDIYTKTFIAASAWQHVLRLIYNFPDKWYGNSAKLMSCHAEIKELDDIVKYDDPEARAQ